MLVGAESASVPEAAPQADSGRADEKLREALGRLVAAIDKTLERDRATRESAYLPNSPGPYAASIFTTRFKEARRVGWPADSVLVCLSMSPHGPERDEIYVSLPSGRIARLRLQPVLRLVSVLPGLEHVRDGAVRERMADVERQFRAADERAAGAKTRYDPREER